MVTIIRDLCARFDAGLKNGAQEVKEDQVSSGGVGDMVGVVEIQAAKGVKGQNGNMVEETRTGENVGNEDVGEIDGLAKVEEIGQMAVKEVNGVEGGRNC